MNKRFIGVFMILAIGVLLPFRGDAAAPQETVETGVNKVLETLGDSAFKAKAKDEQIATISKEIEHIFDFTELSKRTLGRDWKKMSAEQQKEFVNSCFKEFTPTDFWLTRIKK